MRLIKLNENGIVVSVRYNAKNIYEGELYSENGEIGQKMIADGIFEDVVLDDSYELSLEDKINFIYYSQRGFI